MPPSSFPPFPSRETNHLINSVSSLPSLKRIHALILTNGLSRRLALATKLISLASLLSPTVDYARKLFDELPHRDSFAWNTLIRAYADTGPCDLVPPLYQQMHRSGLSPDHFTFPFVIRSCAVLSALREGKEAHCNILKNGFGSNPFSQTALVTMYSQTGEVFDSELVFGETGFRNVFFWTAMVAGYAQNCLFGKAVGVFRGMLDSGTQPNEVTVVSVLPCCNGSNYLFSGRSIHGFVIKMGMDSFVNLANALITMYGKCGSAEIARFLFDGMPVKNLVSWNTMIAVHEQTGAGFDAIELFRVMRVELARFNAVTLVSVLSACASLGALDTGRWVHELARNNGLETDVRVGNALMDMYAKCGSVESARDVFDKLSWRGVVSWSSMIGAYTAHGCVSEALEIFSRMEDEGVRPNSFTFTSVLAACSHSGLVEEGIRHFDSMRREYGITPTLEHCACMVDLLGRAGRLSDAYEFIQTMNIKPDICVWGALLGGCRIHGNLELAETVMADLFRLDSCNVTIYVIMANIYADAGRWEDAARLRKEMKNKELKKIPGISSVGSEKKFLNTRFYRSLQFTNSEV